MSVHEAPTDVHMIAATSEARYTQHSSSVGSYVGGILAEQVMYDDGDWDVFELPNISVHIFSRLSRGAQQQPDDDTALPSPSPTAPPRKRTRAGRGDWAEGALCEETMTRRAEDPDYCEQQQPAAVRVCRRSSASRAVQQAGAMTGVEGRGAPTHPAGGGARQERRPARRSSRRAT